MNSINENWEEFERWLETQFDEEPLTDEAFIGHPDEWESEDVPEPPPNWESEEYWETDCG